jgi:hypothetical protein
LTDKNQKAKEAAKKAKINYIVFLVGSVVTIVPLRTLLFKMVLSHSLYESERKINLIDIF